MDELTPPPPPTFVQGEDAQQAQAKKKYLPVVQRLAVGTGGLGIGWMLGANASAITAGLDAHGGALSAVAGIAVAAFTYTLWRSTDRMQDVTAATLAQVQREFTATHRPKLRIRNVVVRLPATTPRPMTFDPGSLIQGQLYVSNIGDTTATITDSGCWVEWRPHGLPMERPYEGKDGTGFIPPQTLAPGQAWPGVFTSERIMGAEGAAVWQPGRGWQLWVMGWVAYEDDAKRPRRTGFCRQYMPDPKGYGQGHFVTVDNPDYEHEE